MKVQEQALLTAFRQILAVDDTFTDPELDASQWDEMLSLASQQEILPMILDGATKVLSYREVPKERRSQFQMEAFRLFSSQVRRTNEFLTLVLHMQAAGLDPVVLKGIVCRSLYPVPSLRPSVDEDLLIAPEEAGAYHAFLLSEGLFADEPEADAGEAEELSYHRENSPTYIELHKHPFPRDAKAYGDYNELFEGAMERTVKIQVEDVTLRTLCPTDHVLYLICHACKHFLHSGVGIRQMGDIVMFARAYGDAIDWEQVYASCRRKHLERFAGAMLQIGQRYLGLEQVPAPFARLEVDCEALLEDALSDGIYGAEDADRVHSSNLTLDAVAASKQGRGKRGWLRSLFPGMGYMQGRYAYLRRLPWLLPAAWVQRLGEYLLREKANPGRSLQIGRERIELMRQYDLL